MLEDEPTRLLKPDDVAEMLGISKRTLQTWVQTGRIPCIRFGIGKGSIVRFRRKSINEWIQAQEVKADE